MRIVCIVLFVLVAVSDAFMQDVHLSQYYHSPLMTNPALTGKYNSTVRFVANQRQQWKAVTVPYNTFALSAETNRIKENKSLSYGLMLMNDKAGDSQLNIFDLNLSSAYVFAVNRDSTSSMRIGAQVGFSQRKLDWSDLRFDQQYNGFTYDPSFASFEDQSNTNVSFTNVNLGLDFEHREDKRHAFGLGASVFNLLKPDYSFVPGTESKLNERLSLQGFYQTPIHKHWDIIASSQLMWQGAYQEKIVGAMFKKTWQDDNVIKRAGYIGTFARLQDSGYLLLAMDYDDWKFGVSYDFNYSSLNVASNYRGGLELSVIYLLNIFNEKVKPHRACPDYI